MGSFNQKPIPGPKVNLTVIPDPNKPVSLLVEYSTSAVFPAGEYFPGWHLNQISCVSFPRILWSSYFTICDRFSVFLANWRRLRVSVQSSLWPWCRMKEAAWRPLTPPPPPCGCGRESRRETRLHMRWATCTLSIPDSFILFCVSFKRLLLSSRSLSWSVVNRWGKKIMTVFTSGKCLVLFGLSCCRTFKTHAIRSRWLRTLWPLRAEGQSSRAALSQL